MKRVRHKFSRGSILAYSLILLGIVLVASIGMMSASVTNLRSLSLNDKSAIAFQIADSGSQAVITKIRRVSGSTVRDIDTSSNMNCGSVATLSSGSSTGFLGGAYSVTFLKNDGTTLTCTDNISDITSIKSVGSYAETARAVETAVTVPVLVGKWIFNENSGTTVSDSSGNGNDGTIQNGAILTGNSIQFDGVNDVVRIANDSTLDIRKTVSISLWFRVDVLPVTWTPLVSKMNDVGDVNSRTYSIWLNHSGYVHFSSADSSGAQCVNTPSSIVAGSQWHNYVVVLDRDSGTMLPYLDGTLSTTSCGSDNGTVRSTDTVSNTYPVRIGGYFSSDYQDFHGQIDDVHIYDGILSLGEIRDIYNSGRK